jgi:hypothetical protein
MVLFIGFDTPLDYHFCQCRAFLPSAQHRSRIARDLDGKDLAPTVSAKPASLLSKTTFSEGDIF